MNTKELAKKKPMAMPGFVVPTPKEKIEKGEVKQEEQMSIDSVSVTQNVPQTDKKNSKR